jgi:hypothetical protein
VAVQEHDKGGFVEPTEVLDGSRQVSSLLGRFRWVEGHGPEPATPASANHLEVAVLPPSLYLTGRHLHPEA